MLTVSVFILTELEEISMFILFLYCISRLILCNCFPQYIPLVTEKPCETKNTKFLQFPDYRLKITVLVLCSIYKNL
jgi:hypothetical protein